MGAYCVKCFGSSNIDENDSKEALNKTYAKTSEEANNESNLISPIKNFNKEAERIEIIEDEKNNNLVEKNIKLTDFQQIKILGKGSFGKVVLVKRKETNKYYAMKILKKSYIEQKKQSEHTKTERLIMEKMNCSFIVQLHFAFQTQTRLYFVMDFMQGGELFYHLKKAYRFNEAKTKFYAAEIVLALEYLHNKSIIYRDLKPENILLDVNGHLKITDFGLSKMGIGINQKTYSVCGTPEYLAPEIFQRKGHDMSVDWWSLGALIYEMLSGLPPFYNKDHLTMFRNILEKPIEMKSHFSKEAISILNGLLNIDPKLRLGSKSVDEIKNHPFFKEINWKKLKETKGDSTYKLKVNGPTDLRHFDIFFTNETLKESLDSNPVNESHYVGFSYVKRNEFNESLQSKPDNIKNN